MKEDLNPKAIRHYPNKTGFRLVTNTGFRDITRREACQLNTSLASWFMEHWIADCAEGMLHIYPA